MRRSVVAVVTALVLYSAWHSGGHVWRRLEQQRSAYAGYSETQRTRAAVDNIPLPGDVFDFYRSHIRRGDRIYFQVAPGGFGAFFTLPQIVAAIGRYYLLPAVEVPDVAHATVVVSYDADPATLHLHFPTQARAGLNPFFVSRISTP